MNRVLFSSKSPHYATPKALYQALDAEFNFNYDPCPISENSISGLMQEWGTSTYCNPPYGRDIDKWIMKGYQESQNGKTVVFLIASRTDTRWWHEYILKADEIRFIKGRLHFENSKYPAPFPSVIVIFKGAK
jgi:hypothetical protein